MLIQETIQWAPTSVAGWLSLLLSAIALVGVAVGYGKWLEKLNGMGRRVADLEMESASASTERGAQQRSVTRLLDQHEEMLGKLGEAKRDTVACREDTEKLGIDLGSKLSDLTREVNGMNNNLSNRLTRVETILAEK